MVPGTTSVLTPSDHALALGFQVFPDLLDPLPVPDPELTTSLRNTVLLIRRKARGAHHCTVGMSTAHHC